jgi:hypothetical protein
MADMLEMIAFLMIQNAFEQYWFGLARLCLSPFPEPVAH